MPRGFLVPPEKENVRTEGRKGVNVPGARDGERELALPWRSLVLLYLIYARHFLKLLMIPVGQENK